MEFGAGITPSDLTVGLTTDSSDNPALLIQDGNSAVTVDGGLTGSVGQFDFADGTQLTLAGLLADATDVPGSVAGSSGSAILNTMASTLLMGSGDDTILGTGASDTLDAGIGDEYLFAAGADTSVSGGVGNDTLVGAGVQDTVTAGNGNQVLYGLGSADVLVGGLEDDTLYGGTNSDTLVAGEGNTVMYGGAVMDSIVLSAGGTVTLYPSGTSTTELIELPEGMTLADFTAYEGTNGDLILQSVSGDTTAVINGFYTGGSSEKLWMVADGTGQAQLLSGWADSLQSQPPSGYEQEMDELREAFAASLDGTLNQIGQGGGTIQQPGRSISQGPDYQYQFTGVSTQDVTVQGGAVTLGGSDDDQSTYTTLPAGSTTYTVTTPVYGDVTVPGWQQFIPDSSLTSVQIDEMESESSNGQGLGIQQETDASGNSGFLVSQLSSTEYVQTGKTTTVETVPEYTFSEQETQGFTAYDVTGDGGNDVITVGPRTYNSYGQDVGPYFTGTVNTGNGNVTVDLGMNNWYEPLGQTGTWEGYPLPPGAFIEAGSGDDGIVGTGGADVIAAGTGFDYIEAAFGSTVYVPLEGSSTEDIDIVGPYYGNGPLPPSALVLPTGITPHDLTYRLFSGAANSSDQYDQPMETLQISYGDSSVLMDFSPSKSADGTLYLPNVPNDDFNGIDTFQFSDGTVLSRDQLLAMAGPVISAGTLNPTVTPTGSSVTANSIVQGASLFSGSDSSGLPITWYFVSNTGTNGGYFELNGIPQTPEGLYVSADQLPDLTYVPGTAGTSDNIQVSAFDGVVWGSTVSFNVNVTSSSLYTATGPDQEIVGGATGPDTLVGGYGGDTLVGSSAQDTFQYNSGGGAEVISETAPMAATSDNVLELGAGITPSSLTLSAVGGGKLVLATGGNGDSVSIEGFDPLNPMQSLSVQSFVFSDGTSLTPMQLLSDSAVAETSGSITNADGSVTSYDFTPSDQQIYHAQNVNISGHVTVVVSLNRDGSQSTNSYAYSTDGTYSDTLISSPAGGGGSTTTIYGYDASGQMISEQVQNPDGSTASYTYNAQGQELTGDVTNAGGSTADSTLAYNPDGTYSDTIVSTPAGGGGPTTTTYGYDASGQMVSEQVQNPDGSTASYSYNAQGQELTGDVTNADGSTADSTLAYYPDGTYAGTIVSTPAGGGGSTTTTYGYDASGQMVSEQVQYPDSSTASYTYNAHGQELTGDVTNADGSTADSTLAYNPDGTYSDTIISTPAGGGESTTTTYGYNASGQMVSEQVLNPDGSTASYTYNTQGQELTGDVTNADGSTVNSMLTYNPDGTYSDTIVSSPAGGGEATTTVYDYGAQGAFLNENIYTPDADGSYTDSWSKSDGSHGSYWWNASTSEYQESWYNSDGSGWTDEYQYASGGSPGATGYSFLETYDASDGSQGTRQYDASTGAITLSWDSASTGQLSGATTDSGFIGLQNQSELMNTQPDLTFFNPSVSPSFSAFLAA